MRLPPASSRLSVIATALAVLVLLPACTVEAGDEAAHAIAEKFAGEGAPKAAGKAADKIAAAEAPAESKSVVLPAASTQPEVKIISQPLVDPKSAAEKKAPPAIAKPSAAERKQAEAKRKAQEKAETERKAKAQRKADEEDMLARAREEAEDRRIAQEKRLKDIERAEAEAEAQEARKAAEARRLAEQQREREAEEQRKAAEARRLAEIAAQDEARRVTEQREREAESQRKAEETRRLAELAAQEDARRIAEQRQREAEEQRKAAETRRLAEIAAQDEARRVTQQRQREAESQRKAAEVRMMAELAAQEEARRAEQEKLHRAAEERRLAAERLLAEEDMRRAAQTKAVAEMAERTRQAELARQYDQEEARAVRHEVARLETLREAENQRLSDRLREIRQPRSGEAMTMLPPFGLGGPRSTDVYADQDNQDDLGSSRNSTRVTILLLMEPGNRGIRRFNKTGDPILCLDRSCYVSQGAAQPASEIARSRAFGPGVALGSRAGACENSLTCVFRNVDLGGRSAEVQPIDLRVLRHDRRELRAVEADRTCRITSGQLTCRRPVIADSYTLWIVPEAIAERAGAMALETAVRSDSFYEHSASLNR